MQNNGKARQPLRSIITLKRKRFNGRKEGQAHLVEKEDLQKLLLEEGCESDPRSAYECEHTE